MSEMGFSEEERNFVELLARDRHGVSSRFGFYASVLVPVFFFGVFGVLRRDFMAVAIALVGLFIFVWWRLSTELANLKVHRSVFQKVLNHEKAIESVKASTSSVMTVSQQTPG